MAAAASCLLQICIGCLILTISFFIERQDDGKAVPGSKECAEVLPGKKGLRPVGGETTDQRPFLYVRTHLQMPLQYHV